MGIKGLTRIYSAFLQLDSQECVPLQGCPVVVDGSSLLYYLCKRADLEWRYGGQYSALMHTIESFFGTLLAQKVEPIHVVFDGVSPVDKQTTLRKRRRELLRAVIKEIDGEYGGYGKTILPPLCLETFRKFLIDYAQVHTNVRLYCADGEADGLVMSVAIKFGCPLLGEDSDYCIPDLPGGYMPLSMMEWKGVGHPVVGKVYHRDKFANHLGISPNLIVAIPAFVGTDVIAGLDPGNMRYRTYDVGTTIDLLVHCRTRDDLRSIVKNVDKVDFGKNFDKACSIYEHVQPFDDDQYWNPDHSEYWRYLPVWLFEQYRKCMVSDVLLEACLKGTYFPRPCPDDYHKLSTKLCSKPIRQEIYGVMDVRKVFECIPFGKRIIERVVRSTCIGCELSISGMDEASQETRIQKLCDALLCDPCTLSLLPDKRWYIAVASVCYWSKVAHVYEDDYLKIKALLLCFAKCFQRDATNCSPESDLDLDTLHSFTQWQCVYHDAIMLNQILALPLPYLSPASLFDGKCITYYCQTDNFYTCLSDSSVQIQNLYFKLCEVVAIGLNFDRKFC